MFDLEMTEEQRLIHDTVSSFARAEIRPIAHDCDERGSSPSSVLEKGFELGLIHAALPEEHGGYGEDLRGGVRFAEDAGREVAAAGGGVKDGGDEQDADVAAED